MAPIWIVNSVQGPTLLNVEVSIKISEFVGLICDEQRRRGLPVGVDKVFDQFGHDVYVDDVLSDILVNGYGDIPNFGVRYTLREQPTNAAIDRLERIVTRAEQMLPRSRSERDAGRTSES